jgi:hypothetical protein
MAYRIRRAEYFYATVDDQPGEALRLLSALADLGVNLQAFNTVPVGPAHTQVTLFPDDAGKLTSEAGRAGLSLDGPHPALLVQGDDELGALVDLHARIARASVNVYASAGVTDGRGRFGYVVYVKPEEFDRAARAVGV